MDSKDSYDSLQDSLVAQSFQCASQLGNVGNRVVHCADLGQKGGDLGRLRFHDAAKVLRGTEMHRLKLLMVQRVKIVNFKRRVYKY